MEHALIPGLTSPKEFLLTYSKNKVSKMDISHMNSLVGPNHSCVIDRRNLSKLMIGSQYNSFISKSRFNSSHH